jgi:hypothetical protein
MIVRMIVLMALMMFVLMTVIVMGLFSRDHHLHPGRLEGAALDFLRGQLELDAQAAEAGGEVREREAGIDQRAQRHVAAHSGEGVEVGDPRHTLSLGTDRGPSSAQKAAQIKDLPAAAPAVPA